MFLSQNIIIGFTEKNREKGGAGKTPPTHPNNGLAMTGKTCKLFSRTYVEEERYDHLL